MSQLLIRSYIEILDIISKNIFVYIELDLFKPRYVTSEALMKINNLSLLTSDDKIRLY